MRDVIIAILLLVAFACSSETNNSYYYGPPETGGATATGGAAVIIAATGGSAATGGRAATGGDAATGGAGGTACPANTAPQSQENGVLGGLQCIDVSDPPSVNIVTLYGPNGASNCGPCFGWCRIGVRADGQPSGDKFGTCWSCPGTVTADRHGCTVPQ